MPGNNNNNDNSNKNKNECPTFEMVDRKCARCKKTFYTDKEGRQPSDNSCSYHWGKVVSIPISEPMFRDQMYSKPMSEPVFSWRSGVATHSKQGCTFADVHVWSGLPNKGGIIGPQAGYVKTKQRPADQSEHAGIYGLDCEMSYTRAGLELTKLSVVDIDGRLVYESLVLPENEIIDFNTKFSGIKPGDLVSGQTKTLHEVQTDLLEFIHADTIIVGHGLDNDLRAMKIMHKSVVDTSVVFPHFYGAPYRRSLRSLVIQYLRQDIQSSSSGHNSYEDARAAMQLMMWKTNKDLSRREATK